jgi:hypothetical protein
LFGANAIMGLPAISIGAGYSGFLWDWAATPSVATAKAAHNAATSGAPLQAFSFAAIGAQQRS